MKLRTTHMPDGKVLFTFTGLIGGLRLESSGFWTTEETERNVAAIKLAMDLIDLPFTTEDEPFDALITRVLTDKYGRGYDD